MTTAISDTDALLATLQDLQALEPELQKLVSEYQVKGHVDKATYNQALEKINKVKNSEFGPVLLEKIPFLNDFLTILTEGAQVHKIPVTPEGFWH